MKHQTKMQNPDYAAGWNTGSVVDEDVYYRTNREIASAQEIVNALGLRTKISDARMFVRGLRARHQSGKQQLREGERIQHERARLKKIHLDEQADAERRRIKPPCSTCGKPTVCVGECRKCRGRTLADARAQAAAQYAELQQRLSNSYMIKDLLARGWKRSSIDNLLGPPDFIHDYRASHWVGRCVEKRYMKDRVHRIEQELVDKQAA